MHRRTRHAVGGLAAFTTSVLVAASAASATIDWKGHTWQVTSGGMAGVCEGSAANVSVDANGYLHLHVSKSGSTWTAAEIFTTDELHFGTYQWQLDGAIDSYDKNVVVGLFPYGPAAGIGSDGTNEIDIEYSRWGYADGPNGDYTDYPASGTTIGELSYTFSLAGSTLSTSRFTWTAGSITSSLFGALVPVTSSDNPLQQWTYAPPNPSMNVPQQALPLGMNLWCFNAPPSDGQAVELVIRDFTFVPADAGTGGAGGGGIGGATGAGGAMALGGATALAGASGMPSGAGGTRTANAGAGGTPHSGAGGTASAGAGGRLRAGAGGAPAGAGGTPSTSAAGNTSTSPGAAGSGANAEVGGASASAGMNQAGGMPSIGAAGSGVSAGAGAMSANGAAARGCGCAVPRRDDRELPSGVVLLLAIGACWRRRRTVDCRRR